MKKLKGKLILLIFLFSWILLFYISGSNAPWQNFDYSKLNSNEVVAELGDISSLNYDRMGFTKAIVRYVESENAWIVGTERGELFLFSNEGKQLWKHSLGIGKLIAIAISNNSKIAYVGEQSPAGNLYAINTHNGDILWKLAASDFIGTDPSLRSYPSIVHISVDKNDNVYANAYRFLMKKNGDRGYDGKMLAVSMKGELLWKFPKEGNIDSWINWCDVNDNNQKVVISTSAYEFREEMNYKDTMYLPDNDKIYLENILYNIKE